MSTTKKRIIAHIRAWVLLCTVVLAGTTQTLKASNFNYTPQAVAELVVCAGVGIFLSCAGIVYTNYTHEKQLKTLAQEGYYEPKRYEQLIIQQQSRHIPLVIVFDEDEHIRSDGNDAMSRVVNDALYVASKGFAPICIITTPSIARICIAKDDSEPLSKQLNIFSLQSKGLDLVLLVPKSFDNVLLKEFNLSELMQFEGEHCLLAPWLACMEAHKQGSLYDDRLREIFAQRDQPDIIWDIHITGHGWPAASAYTLGITHKQIQSLLAMLNTNLHVGLVHLSSCYLPGSLEHITPATIPDRYMQPLHYPVIVHGVYNDVVYGSGLGDYSKLSPQQILLSFWNAAASVTDKGASLDRMLKSLTDTDSLNVSIMQVLLPGHDAFHVFGNHQLVLTLGPTLHQRMLYEQKPLDVHQQVVLVYPSSVEIPLHVHSFKNKTRLELGRDEHARLFALLDRGVDTHRYPRFICMQQEKKMQNDFKISFGDIFLQADAEADPKKLGVLAFISDAFRTFNKKDFMFNNFSAEYVDASRSYAIASVTGSNDIKHWFNAMGAVQLAGSEYKDVGTCTDVGKAITIRDVHIKYYGAWCSSTFTTLDFALGAYQYNLICINAQLYWMVKPYAAQDDIATHTAEIAMQASRYNMRDRVRLWDVAAAHIKTAMQTFAPKCVKNMVQRIMHAAEQRVAPTFNTAILARLLNATAQGDFISECMQRVIACPALADRVDIMYNQIVEHIEHKTLSLDTYEAYLAALLTRGKVDVSPLFMLLEKNVCINQIADMVQRLIALAGVRRIHDVVLLWAGLCIKKAVVFEDIVALVSNVQDKRALLKYMADLLDGPGAAGGPDELQLLSQVIPVMLDLWVNDVNDPKLADYVLPALECGLKLLVEHAVIDQAQADCMLAQAESA